MRVHEPRRTVTETRSPHARANADRCGLHRDRCDLQHRPCATDRSPCAAEDNWRPQSRAKRSVFGQCASIAGPLVPENERPHAFLAAAWSAVDRGQSEEAQDALQRAEARLLDRAVAMNSAQKPDDRRAVLGIGVARQALAAGDRPGALRAIDDACAAAGGGVSPLPPGPDRCQVRIEQVQTLVARQILTTKFSVPPRSLSDGLARQLRITVRERRCDRSSCQ